MSLLINKVLEICLRISGVWPYSFSILGPTVLMSALITTLPFQCWEASFLLNSPVLLMDSLSDILAEILIFMKLFAIWINKRRIEDLIRVIDNDWNKKNLPAEWKILARYCYLFCKYDISLYLSAAFLYYPELISTYIKKPIEDRQLLFQSYYPFDYQSSPRYELLLAIQGVQGVFMMSVDALSKSLLITCVLHVGARMYVFESHVLEYSNSCSNQNNIDDKSNAKSLKNMIVEHQNILALVQNIDSVFSYICFFQILFSNVIICVTGYVMITAMQSTNAVFLIRVSAYILTMLSQAFTFCIAGQYLRNKGESLVHLIHNSFWYNTKPKEIRKILFILVNAQKPLTLNGGKMFGLSINTFAQILKTSFSYLSVLRAAYT